MTRLRPTPSRWFETYVPREQLVLATEVLARTGAVELETVGATAGGVDEERLRHFVERFRALAAEHARDLPGVGQQATTLEGDPVHLANLALHRLRNWCARIDYVKARLAQLNATAAQLERLQQFLAALERTGHDPDQALQRTRLLRKSLLACPKGSVAAGTAGMGLDTLVEGRDQDFIFTARMPEQAPPAVLAGDGPCVELEIPAWLRAHGVRRREALALQQGEVAAERARLKAELKELRRDPQLGGDLANVETLHWYLQHAAGHLTRDSHCHLSGWTTVDDVRELQRALEAAQVRTIIRSPRPPLRLTPPVSTFDAWWARPFRSIMDLWGTPGAREVDPSALLALVVPLLFGYMFPDVGHGLVLLVFAVVYSWRRPQFRFLVPCALASIGFGFLAGDIFGIPGLIPALWPHPLADPIPLLLLPMLLGIGLMLVGLAFAGIEAYWRNELRPWLLIDGAVLVIYVCLLLAGLAPWLLVVAGLATLHYLVASALLAPPGQRPAAVPQALVDLLLSVFELVMNTLSFIRVGAFALAHLALSQAILALAEPVDNSLGKALILIAGNAFAIAVEGLLVYVQTTRLVLFEFFVRFLQAEGRLFRPLARSPRQ